MFVPSFNSVMPFLQFAQSIILEALIDQTSSPSQITKDEVGLHGFTDPSRTIQRAVQLDIGAENGLVNDNLQNATCHPKQGVGFFWDTLRSVNLLVLNH